MRGEICCVERFLIINSGPAVVRLAANKWFIIDMSGPNPIVTPFQSFYIIQSCKFFLISGPVKVSARSRAVMKLIDPLGVK